MHRVRWSLFVLVGLAGCPSEGPASIFCEDGADGQLDLPSIRRVVVVEGEACVELTEVTGECLVWAEYVAYEGTQPPVEPCNPADMSFTEVATGDCLSSGTTCPGILDDPAYADCSESTFAGCCTENGEFQVITPCDPPGAAP